MVASEYEFRLFAAGDRDGVLRVLRHLWGEGDDSNAAYFGWKYGRNPYAPAPLGVVALSRGQVVGFRAYLATPWWIPAQGVHATFLCPGDTCVDPAHRRQGLSVAMGRVADEAYASEFPLYVNLSGSPSSVPGYLRVGFHPVVPKTRRFRLVLRGLLRRPFASRRALDRRRARDTDAPFYHVSNLPLPDEMAAVAESWSAAQTSWTLHQEPSFFSWRYGNVRSAYRFYRREEEHGVTAYLVVAVLDGGRHGWIVDYAGLDATALAALLGDLIRHEDFAFLSAHDFAADPKFAEILGRLGFRADGLLARLARRRTPDMPMLVRPVRGAGADDDWRVGPLDVRAPASWEVKGIAFDSA